MKAKDTDMTLEIQRLKAADPDTLRRSWRSVFRKAFPDHLPRHLIVTLTAWQLQADRLGGLTKEEEKYLSEAASKPHDAPLGRYGRQDGTHQPGTVFVREYEGVLHQVAKTADGYRWQGREYGSLSAVASAITGTNWNGRRFFGLPAAEGKRRGRG